MIINWRLQRWCDCCWRLLERCLLFGVCWERRRGEGTGEKEKWVWKQTLKLNLEVWKQLMLSSLLQRVFRKVFMPCYWSTRFLLAHFQHKYATTDLCGTPDKILFPLSLSLFLLKKIFFLLFLSFWFPLFTTLLHPPIFEFLFFPLFNFLPVWCRLLH